MKFQILKIRKMMWELAKNHFSTTSPPESLLRKAQFFMRKFNENIMNIISGLSTRRHLIWFVSTNHVLLEHIWGSRNQAVWSLWKEQKQKRTERSRKFTNLTLVILMPDICQILLLSVNFCFGLSRAAMVNRVITQDRYKVRSVRYQSVTMKLQETDVKDVSN